MCNRRGAQCAPTVLSTERGSTLCSPTITIHFPYRYTNTKRSSLTRTPFHVTYQFYFLKQVFLSAYAYTDLRYSPEPTYITPQTHGNRSHCLLHSCDGHSMVPSDIIIIPQTEKYVNPTGTIPLLFSTFCYSLSISLSFSMARFSMRETCTCDTPTMRLTCCCVKSRE